MKIIFNKKKLIKFIHNEKNLGFVPTMGAIHLGHISLIKKSNKICQKTIVSIFVNKPQFNKKSDFQKYPRVIKRDISILKKSKVHCLYIPRAKEIYPAGINNKIKINSFSKRLCGKFRPGHFRSVVDVIDRFLKIIKPEKIFLGEKDMQQLMIVKKFIKKNHPRTIVVGCKTIREKNGIAFSSRNILLSKNEKKIAAKIYKLLLRKKSSIINSKISLNAVNKEILKFGVRKIDYLKLLDINKLIKPYIKINKYKLFIAYYLKKNRLIDNI